MSGRAVAELGGQVLVREPAAGAEVAERLGGADIVGGREQALANLATLGDPRLGRQVVKCWSSIQTTRSMRRRSSQLMDVLISGPGHGR